MGKMYSSLYLLSYISNFIPASLHHTHTSHLLYLAPSPQGYFGGSSAARRHGFGRMIRPCPRTSSDRGNRKAWGRRTYMCVGAFQFKKFIRGRLSFARKQQNAQARQIIPNPPLLRPSAPVPQSAKSNIALVKAFS